MRLIIPFILLGCSVHAQSFSRNRFTFSGGWADQIGPSYGGESATSIGLTYGYRASSHVEFEAGVQTALHPGTELRGAFYDFKPDDRYIWIPVGVRFIAPLDHDRFELSAGGGGLYQRYFLSNGQNNPFNVQPYDAWGGYLVGSVSAALDRSRHFWLGSAPRFFIANGASRRDRWFTITGEFSFRF